ncbi:MAG: tRNA dihydrouridine synthase DusB [Bacilli bacterium]
MKWKIGNVEIDNQVVLAPMAGVTDSAFRKIAKEFGCGLVCAEMVSDKAIIYGSKKTIDMLTFNNFERPISQQIFGSDKDSFVKAAKYIEKEMEPDIIDINMGCPVPKVAVRAQAGAALLRDLNKIYDIVKDVVNSVDVPVTVKIRSGWDGKSINAVEVAKICEQAGASAITIHGRTRKQGYGGKADWDIIKEVKKNISIPVIGNGDIKTPFDAKKMLEETGCDAVMIGRGVLGNPWLIRQIIKYLDKNILIKVPNNDEKINMCLKHFKYLLELKGDKLALLEMRGHASWYIKGIEGASDIRRKINNAKSVKELEDVLLKYKKGLG